MLCNSLPVCHVFKTWTCVYFDSATGESVLIPTHENAMFNPKQNKPDVIHVILIHADRQKEDTMRSLRLFESAKEKRGLYLCFIKHHAMEA